MDKELVLLSKISEILAQESQNTQERIIRYLTQRVIDSGVSFSYEKKDLMTEEDVEEAKDEGIIPPRPPSLPIRPVNLKHQ